MSRLPKGGLIDRDTRLSFEFDGKEFYGHPGDTLASALLANDVRLMGRSFKYHRPRGVVTAGSEEPNALMEIGEGAERSPNTRATTQEIYDGLVAHSQNRYPNLKFDLLGGLDVLSPFLGAGFYYKTFMWPAAFWERVYEPLIRRAAGLGALSGDDDPATYDKAWAHCDLLIIGAGPAGLMAALVAGRSGAKVILADEDFVLGGRLNSEQLEVGDQSGADWAVETVAELISLPNVTVMPRTTITGVYDGNTYSGLQRLGDHSAPSDRPRQCFWRIIAKQTILATGAIERPIAFPNNDRPGIMMAGAVRSYANRFGVAAGARVAVFTNNDDGWRTARDLKNAGIPVSALIDTRADVSPDVDCPVYTGAEIVNTGGRLGLERLSVRVNGEVQQINADCLAVSGGWNPSLHLTCHKGGKPEWREDIAAFTPKTNAVANLVAVGAANGSFSTHGALSEGLTAAKAALKSLGVKPAKLLVPDADDAPTRITPFWHVAKTKGRAWLDFQNDVSVKDVVQAHGENFRSVEHMKRYTTLGMATDQGKLSNVAALAVMAELSGRSISDTGTTVFRPPYTPVQIGAMGANGAGVDFAPEHLPPAHSFVTKHATMMETGLWQRAAYFPREDETFWRHSCDREVQMVRDNVGVFDASTLGKIDVQGPDAAIFLDRIYTTTISTMKTGRVRYGLMLREDGFVMDDGTVARLAEQHFVLTTTTGAIEQILSHLEFCAQCLWPNLDVHIQSVTDQWAQIAISGPRSREILSPLVDTDIPFMGCVETMISGVPIRLFRISFSGELGFEIAIGASHGAALMQGLTKAAEKLGGGAYGLEAANVLRIEKGFLTHSEINGRVTAGDVGMASKKPQEYIGKIASQRDGLLTSKRERLVGIRPIGTVKQILGGSLIFDEGDESTRENMRGHVTSACYSPTLGGMIGLALIQNGRARIGEHIRAVDLLRDLDTMCEIVSPVFYDPKGEKARG